MTRETREILIGAATVLGLLAVLGFMNARSEPLAAGRQVVLQAKFNKVDGLADGAEVRMAGIAVGKVVGMKLDPKYRAVIAMRIDAPVGLPKDSSASIHTDGLFGSKFVVLSPGAEEGVLKSGDEVQYTQDAVVVGDLMELIISEGKNARAEQAAKTKAQAN
ncbi:MAG: MlaD family protein [Rhodospirillaceae bacterium]|jgi:phospholipid/cholesterol/gamma-HCH transport system substrate-binding protein